MAIYGPAWLELLDVRKDEVEQADPDFVRMLPCNVAMQAWLRSISSATMAGSVWIGPGAPPGGVPPEPSSGS